MNRLAELNNGIEGGAGPVAVEPPPELDIPKYVSELRVIETRLMKDIEQLRGFGETILKLPPSEESRNELEPILQQYRPIATRVKKELDTLRNDNERIALETTVKGGAEEKMRQNVYLRLLRAFKDALFDLNEAQTEHKHKYIEKVTRTAKIVSPEIDEKAIEELVDRGEGDMVFAERVLGQRKQDAAEALVYVQGQYRDLAKLQESILQLHQMFLDMQTLVDMQGEQMNHIEETVNRSVAYAGDATKHAERAEKANIQTKNRRACCGAGLGGVMAVMGGGLAAGLAGCTIM